MCDYNGTLKDTLYDEWFSNIEGEHIGWVVSLERLKKINRPTNLIFKMVALIPPGKNLSTKQHKSHYRDSLVEEFLNTISEKEEYIISITFTYFNACHSINRNNVHYHIVHELLLRLHHLKHLSLGYFLYDIPDNVKKTLVSIDVVYNMGRKYVFDSCEFKLLASINIKTADLKGYEIHEDRIVLDETFKIRDNIRYLKICTHYDRHMLSDIFTKYILNCKTLFSFKSEKVLFKNDYLHGVIKRSLILNRIRHILKYNLPRIHLYTLLKLINNSIHLI